MDLRTPKYRTNYVGETINKIVDGKTVSYAVSPRPNVFKGTMTDTAIVLGNGLTKLSREAQQLLTVNSNKVAEAYKLVYACNMAVTDTMPYDYYVLKDEAFIPMVSPQKLSQVYLPYDLYMDKQDANLLPYVSHMDAGASAAYLAAFDDHKKIFLLGFDGDSSVGYKTVYDGQSVYPTEPQNFNENVWRDYLWSVMRAYKGTQFYRLKVDGAPSPAKWTRLPNFRDVSLREAVLLGDF